MFQEFFKDTLMSRFIKRLLRSTPLPLLHIVHEGSYLIEDCYYIYDNCIIKCVKSGNFYIDSTDSLTPGNTLYSSGDTSAAKYKVIKSYDNKDPEIHYNFHSKYLYHDPDTHFHLGEYLRYLQATTGLNLMPYYNCFNNKQIKNVYLKSVNRDDPTDRSFVIGNNSQYKLLAVPVKFGKTYTIAIDSDYPVYIRPLIYNDDTGCVVKPGLKSDITYYSDKLENLEIQMSTSFHKPFIVKIGDADTSDLFAQEKNLYLIIQVSVNNNSALTVLEGDYTKSWSNIISSAEAPDDLKNYYRNISLLMSNSRTSWAFSDRLVEYLLHAVINDQEIIDKNIEYLQLLLSEFDSAKYSRSKRTTLGIWEDKLRSDLWSVQEKVLDVSTLRDLDGYLNKDLEKFLLENKEK